MSRAGWVFALALVGCNKGDTGPDPLPATGGDGAGSDCGDTPPVIEDFTISDGGLWGSKPDDGDDCTDGTPTILLQVYATDADADLNYWTLTAWWDENVDGVVDTSGEAPNVYSTIGDPCEVDDAHVGMRLCIGGDPPYSSEVEFGVIVTDDMDNASDEAIATFTTPDESGNY